jgi:hypothetical protein
MVCQGVLAADWHQTDLSCGGSSVVAGMVIQLMNFCRSSADIVRVTVWGSSDIGTERRAADAPGVRPLRGESKEPCCELNIGEVKPYDNCMAGRSRS